MKIEDVPPLLASPPKLAGWQAEQLLGAPRHVHAVAHEVPVEDALVRTRHRQSEAFFRQAQGFLGALALGDVAPYASVALEVALAVEDRRAADADIAGDSVWSKAATFEVAERLASGKYGLVLSPGTGQGRHARQFPAHLADRRFARVSGQVTDPARHVREAQVLVLLPVPVG